jgi:hypothetical protein
MLHSRWDFEELRLLLTRIRLSPGNERIEGLGTGGAPAADSLASEIIKKFPNAIVCVLHNFDVVSDDLTQFYSDVCLPCFRTAVVNKGMVCQRRILLRYRSWVSVGSFLSTAPIIFNLSLLDRRRLLCAA